MLQTLTSLSVVVNENRIPHILTRRVVDARPFRVQPKIYSAGNLGKRVEVLLLFLLSYHILSMSSSLQRKQKLAALAARKTNKNKKRDLVSSPFLLIVHVGRPLSLIPGTPFFPFRATTFTIMLKRTMFASCQTTRILWKTMTKLATLTTASTTRSTKLTLTTVTWKAVVKSQVRRSY